MEIEVLSTEKERKNRFFVLICSIAVPVTVVFFVINYMKGNTVELIIDALLCLFFVAGFVSVKKTNTESITFRLIISLIILSLLYGVSINMGDGTILNWLFFLPLGFLYFFGKKEGLIFIIGLFIFLCALLFNPFSFEIYVYSLETGFRYLVSFVTVAIITYGLESSRQRFREALIEKHSELETANRDLKSSYRKRKSLFDNAEDSIMVVDPNTGQFLDCNINAHKRLGYSREEFLKLKVYELNDDITKEEIDSLLGKQLKGEKLHLENKHKKKDGTYIPVEITSTLVNTDSKEVVLAFVRDITERKMAEEALSESEKRYRNLFEQSNDAIFVHQNREILYMNESACRLLGYDRDQLNSMSIDDFIAEDHRGKIKGRLDTTLNKGSNLFESQWKRKDGTIVTVEVSPRAIDKDKMIVQSVARDITERKRVEEEREKLINDLQEALSEVKTLKGILPICANCKKIRNDEGYWDQVESYVDKHTEATFSHGICPDCAKILYPDLDFDQGNN